MQPRCVSLQWDRNVLRSSHYGALKLCGDAEVLQEEAVQNTRWGFSLWTQLLRIVIVVVVIPTLIFADEPVSTDSRESLGLLLGPFGHWHEQFTGRRASDNCSWRRQVKAFLSCFMLGLRVHVACCPMFRHSHRISRYVPVISTKAYSCHARHVSGSRLVWLEYSLCNSPNGRGSLGSSRF